jgi:hypothetical protein
MTHPSQFVFCRTSAELWQHVHSFCAPLRVSDRERSSTDRESEWNTLYDAVVDELREVGKFSEGCPASDSDFCSSRHVPPSRNIVFTLDSIRAFDARVIRGIFPILAAEKLEYLVTLDFDPGYVSIFPDGRIFGFSEDIDDLIALGFPVA